MDTKRNKGYIVCSQKIVLIFSLYINVICMWGIQISFWDWKSYDRQDQNSDVGTEICRRVQRLSSIWKQHYKREPGTKPKLRTLQTMQGIRWIKRRNKELTKVREVSGTILTGMLFFVSRFWVSQNKKYFKGSQH